MNVAMISANRIPQIVGAIFLTAVSNLISPASAGEYRGRCYFNSMSMPCTISQNPFTMTMRWADGISETYSHQGDGVFVDKRGGIWRPKTNVSRGEFWMNKNGNTFGFIEY